MNRLRILARLFIDVLLMPLLFFVLGIMALLVAIGVYVLESKPLPNQMQTQVTVVMLQQRQSEDGARWYPVLEFTSTQGQTVQFVRDNAQFAQQATLARACWADDCVCRVGRGGRDVCAYRSVWPAPKQTK